MKKSTFSKTYQYFFMIIVLLCNSNILAQSEKSSLTKIEELRSNPDFNPQDSDYIDLLLGLAKSNIRSNPDSTAILLKEGYELSLTSKYRIGESTALATYGYLFSEKGEIEKAYQYNLNAIEVANTYNLAKEKIIALNNMGLDFWYQGNHEKALTQYLEALATAKESENTLMIPSLNNNIALLYDNNGDFETALTFYEISRQYCIENDNEELLASISLNMASIYSQTEKIVEAERMVNKSIQIFKKINSKDWLSNAYTIKGDIALKTNNYQEALEWYKKSEKLCDEIDFGMGYTYTYKGLAESYLGLKNLDFAEAYALKGFRISKKLNLSETIKELNLVLSKIYHEKGQDKKAYEYQDKYINLYEKDAAEKFKKGLGVLRSKIKFESQKKLLIEEQNKAIAKQKSYVYLAIAALFVVLLFLVFIFRANKLQKKYTNNLQDKQEILILREAELNDSNKTKDKLFSIIAHDLRGPIGSFHSIMKMYLDDSISKEESDKIFPKALQEIQGISQMLNNLLIWAKTQMKGIVIKQQNIDINNIVKETIMLLNTLAENKALKIINNIPENTISFSDRNYIDIIVRNLISNSIKFTNHNGEISINAIEKDHELQIEVKDNGVGMDLETQNMIFKKNQTKSTYGTNNEKGTGLGLSLCKDMVESNGGKIWVSSVINQGTSIYFTIPLELEYLKTI